MKKTALIFLPFLMLLAYSLPVLAQEETAADAPEQAEAAAMEDTGDMPDMMSDMDGPGHKCPPGCTCERCMKAKAGKRCGHEGRCDKCMKHDMKHGNKDGMMGMSGDMDRMTWPRMNKSCRTPDYYLKSRDALELSDYQVDALEKLFSSLKKDMILKGANVKVLEMELSDIVTKVDFKLPDAQDKLKEIEKARTELRTAVVKASAAARDVLSPEQQGKVKEMGWPSPDGCCGKCADCPKAVQGAEMKQMMMERMRQRMAP